MGKTSSAFMTKGIIYLICGILIGFFPGIISWIFYIVGGLIIIGSVLMLITGAGSGLDGSVVGGAVAGIIVGAIICLIPRIISVGIPIAAGIIFIISGITRFFKSLKAEKSELNTASMIFGILLAAFGGFLLFNPFKASFIIRMSIGILLIVLAVFSFYAARIARQRKKNTIPDTIDV